MRFAAPTTPLHAGLPLGDHERGVQRHPRRARATQQAAHLELGPRGRRGLEPGLLEHAGRRLPPAQRLDRRRRHPQLPDRLPPSLRSDRADPGRKLRSRRAARVRQPQRRHAAPGRRAARHRDRRLDRPPRSLRQPPLVDPLPVPYPSDAQLLPDGQVLVASFAVPGQIVIVNRSGVVTWSFGAASGPNRLAKPSLDGHTGVRRPRTRLPRQARRADLLPATGPSRGSPSKRSAPQQPRLRVSRVGSLPQPVSSRDAARARGARGDGPAGLPATARRRRLAQCPSHRPPYPDGLARRTASTGACRSGRRRPEGRRLLVLGGGTNAVYALR
jgi:hypothetical protein